MHREEKLFAFSSFFGLSFCLLWDVPLGVHSGSPDGKSGRGPNPTFVSSVCMSVFACVYLLSICAACVCVKDCMHVVCIPAFVRLCSWHEMIQSVSSSKRENKQTNSVAVGSCLTAAEVWVTAVQ